MALGSTTTIKIPIEAELQNTQKIVAELRNVLSKMNPDTKGFKEINSLLDTAEKKLETIQQRSTHGVINTRELNSVQKEFTNALFSIEKAAGRVQNLRFDNLNLSDNQKKQFEDIKNRIEAVRQAYADLEHTKLSELAQSSQQLEQSLQKVGVNIDTDSIETSLNKVSTAIANVKKEIEDLQSKQNAQLVKVQVRDEQIAELEKLKNIFSSSASERAQNHSDFFTANGNFKAGQKDVLAERLAQLGLDDVSVSRLKSLSASRISEVAEAVNKVLDSKIKAKNREKSTAETSAREYATRIADAQLRGQELENLRSGISNLRLDPELQNSLVQTIDRVAQLEQEIEQLKAKLLEQSGASNTAANALNGASQAASSAAGKFGQVADDLNDTAIAARNMESIKMAVTNFLGFNQVLNIVRNSIRNAINHIKELDTTMNGIAIVTNMTTADLWKQVDAYSSMAQKFGVTIQGAYEVSKIYYQAGYDTNEVLTLTNETLKLSKISGLDYATTTDYMMTAMRGFKLEMEDASRVVDVYSNLAANTAVSQQELAEAMTRTASSMESVGATFEETSAMIATMVAVTRESANNIGSAMKSIASRYGELTKDPGKLFDAEGEAMSFNKVDTALKSVGITLQTTEHQFRDFTDVIIELAEKWDTLDSAQQRYIATQFAGNRQQSRFLALVSNVDLLKENIGNAENSEDVGTLQYLKALDSLESKINQVQVAYQQFYTTIGIEGAWKTFLDGVRNTIDTLNRLPKLFGKVPVLAIAMIGNLTKVTRAALRILFKMIISDWQTAQKELSSHSKDSGTEIGQGLISYIIKSIREGKQRVVQETKNVVDEAKTEATNAAKDNANTPKASEAEKSVGIFSKLGQSNGLTKTFSALSGILSVVSLIIPTASEAGKVASGAIMGVAGALKILGAASATNPVLAVISGIAMIASGIATFKENEEETLERLNAEAEELNNKAKEAKANYNTLQRSIDKVEELKQKRYESAEAAEEYQTAVNELAEAFPEMIQGFDEAGNIVVDITNKEELLAKAREKTAKATYEAAKSELKATEEKKQQAKENANESIGTNESYVKFSENNLHDFFWDLLGEDSETQLKFLANHINWDEYGKGYSENAYNYHDRNEMLGIYLRQGGAISDLLQEKNVTFSGLEGTIDDFKNIFQLLDLIDITSGIGQNLYTQAKKLYDKAKKDSPEIEQKFGEVFKSAGDAIDEYNSYAKLSTSEIKTIVSAWQNLNKEFSYIANDSGFASIITENIAKELEAENITDPEEIEKYLNGSKWQENIEVIDSYWTSLAMKDKDRAARLKEMLANPEKYTAEDILKEFDFDEEIRDLISNAYKERLNNVEANLNKTIRGDSETGVKGLVGNLSSELSAPLELFVNSFGEAVGEISYEEAQILGDAAREYTEMAQNGFVTQGENLLIGVEHLFNAIKDNPLTESYVNSLIKSNSLFTKEGIDEIISGIESNDDITEETKENLVKTMLFMRSNIIDNYALSVQAAISELEDGWENAGKEMAKLRSGASLKEANAVIENAKALGIEISRDDFSGPANKLVLSEGKFYEYFYASQKKLNSQANEMAENVKNLRELQNKFIANDDIGNYKEIIGNAFGEDYYQKLATGKETWDDFNQKVEEYAQDVSDYQLMLQQTQEQMLREINWAIGNYSDLFKNGFDESKLRGAAAQGGRNLSRTQISEREAVKKINDAYGKLISDVLSKGFANIDLTNYQGLFDNGIDIELKGSYQDFVRQYVDLTGKTAEEINSIMVQAIEKDNQAVTTLVSSIKNMSSASVSQIGQIANILSDNLGLLVDPNAIIRSVKQNKDGTYDVSNYIVNFLIPQLFKEEVPEAIQKALDDMLTSAAEAAIKGLQDVSTSVTKGFSNIEEIEKYGRELKNIENFNSGTDYYYSNSLKQYVLTASGIKKSIYNYQAELAKNLALQGKTESQIKNILKQETKELLTSLAGQVDIQKYLSSEKSASDTKDLRVAFMNWKRTAQAVGQTVSMTFKEFINGLNKGGEEAVAIAQAFARQSGKELSAKDIETVYRASVSKLENSIEQISYGIGAIVDKTTAEIIGLDNVDQIANTSQYVITSTIDLAKAYKALYDKFEQNNQTTLAQLNSIKALQLENESDKLAVEFLGDAAKMTWTRLAEVFSQAGIKLTDTLVEDLKSQNVIKELGGGKLRITKPEQLFAAMGIKGDSEEYTSALKTLNDALIEANDKVSRNIMEELQKVAAAKPGEQINLTQLYKELGRAGQNYLAGLAREFGAEFDSGILTIFNNTNIVGLVENIIAYAEQKELLLEDQMAQLADTLSDTLNSYIDILKNGIAGTLSNANANTLQSYATSLGLGKLDFTQTANGLKISADSAIKLYSAIKETDKLKAQLVFDDLSASIQKSQDGLENLSSTLRTIKKLEEELGKTPNNKAVADRLALYKEIAAQQAADPEQYNFMNRSLPNGMKGVENYWNSAGAAFNAMNEAGQTGYMEIQDFYNIVNEMTNLAALSGESIEFMGQTIDGDVRTSAKLIEQAMSALTNIDGEGVKLSLAELGANLFTGAEDMQNGFDKGIQAMAKAQIKMLDAMIQMLEGIVALQELGEIDADSNGIDFSELFIGDEKTGQVDGFQKKAQETAQDILKAAEANEDLEKALDTFKLGELSLREVFNAIAKNKWDQLDGKITPEQLLSALNIFKDIDFDSVDFVTIQQVIQEAFNKIFPEQALLNDPEVDKRIREFAINKKKEIIDEKEYLRKAVNTAREQRTEMQQMMIELAYGNITYDEKTESFIGAASGTNYGSDEAKALLWNMLENSAGYKGDGKDINFDANNKNASVELKYGKIGVKVQADLSGGVKYFIGNDSNGYDTLDEAIVNSNDFNNFKTNNNILSESEALTQYKYAVGIEVSPVVRFNPNKDVNKETINKAIQAIQDYMSGSEVSLSDAVTAAKAAGIQFNSETEVTMPQLQNALDKLLAFEEQQNQSETIGHLTSAQQSVDTNTTALQNLTTVVKEAIDAITKDKMAEAPDAKGAIEKKGAEAAAVVLENVKTGVAALGDVKAKAAAELKTVHETKMAADAEAAEEAARLAAAREEAARIANEVTQQILQEAQTALDGIKDEAAASADELLNAQDQAKKAQENAEKAANEATQLRQQAEEALAQAKLDSQKLSGEMSAAAQSALDQATAAAESAKKSEEAAIESAKKAGENVGKVNEAIEEAIQKLDEKLKECETKLAQTADELKAAEEGLKTGSTDKSILKEIFDRILALKREKVETAEKRNELERGLGPQSSSDAGNVVQPTPRPPQEDNIVEKQEEVIETQKNTAEFQIDAAQAQLEALKSLLAQITNSDIYQNAQKKLNPAMATVEGFTDEENAVANLYNVIVGQIKNLEKEIEEYKEANKEVTETVNENTEAAEKNTSGQKENSESAQGAGDGQKKLAGAQDNTANSANNEAAAQNGLAGATRDASGGVNGLEGSIQELSDAASAAAMAIAGAAKAAGEAAEQAYQAAQSAQSTTNSVQSTTNGVSGGARNDAAQQTHTVNAKGNVALAGGTRSTLMGELGPELYVANGHYYVAGQNGAEFVDLPSDAIVFNHLQTERLLKNGSAGRGHAITNDRKATSLATGNVSGPAMASAQTVLAQLKQIRAMWDAMLNASVSDLGSKAGLGKKAGGGGGSKDKGQVVKLDSGYIRDLERWYNLLRQIDRLEQDINYEEKLRSKLQADTVANGELIYESQRRTYEMLQRELDDRVELASLKKGYYEQRMAEIQAGPWGQLFYFNEEGVPQMKNLQFLADVFASSEEGGAVHNAREQYAMLQQAGFGSLLQYKDDGSIIEWTDDEGKPREEAYKEAVEAFSAKLDAQTEEVNSLREDYIEEMGNILDLQTQQNEILTQIRENTIAVEQEVLKAIEDFREREIDELQKQRDALSDSADKFIDGLTDSLNKEREMYNSQQEDTELLQMRRQLAILQRSGGSASQIRSLQEQIRQREQEAYFNEQENQINAIKEASDLQLERLDAQISLMQETLEYQKAHGLLWEQVHEIMQGTHEEITQFVTGNNSEWWAKSATQAQNDLVELDNKIGQWVAHRDDISALGETMKNAINNGIAAITSVVAQVSASQQYTVSGTGSYTIPSRSSSSGGGGGSSSSSSKKTGSSSKKTSNSSAKSWHVSASPSLSFATQSAAQEYQKKQTNLAWNSYHSNEDDKELYDEYRKWSTAHISQYSGGGLIDYTGPAWVDGTKKRPEGILNAEQLDMLRNSVLTRKNPIAALLADYGNTVSDTANANTYNSIDRGGDTVIENAQVVMNVSKMSNDYDAKRAGKTALEEMLRISRKTKPTSVSRR